MRFLGQFALASALNAHRFKLSYEELTGGQDLYHHMFQDASTDAKRTMPSPAVHLRSVPLMSSCPPVVAIVAALCIANATSVAAAACGAEQISPTALRATVDLVQRTLREAHIGSI